MEWLKNKKFIDFDIILSVVLVFILATYYFEVLPRETKIFIMALVSYIATIPVALSAIKSLKKGKINVDLLAAVALVFSLLSKEWTSAIFINLMLASARILTKYSENRARRNIEHLLKLKPVKVKVKRDGKIVELPAEHVKKDDLVVVELGEMIPVDGTVIDGQAAVDQSSLTGESIPVSRQIGDQVFSSGIIVSGNLTIRAEKVREETTLEKVIKLVEQSQSSKAPISTIADKFAGWYIAIIIVGSIVLYLATKNILLILSVLLVVCADDIAVAIPLAFLTAIGYAARQGVIIKGSSYLEGMTKIGTMLVDKTGTLTRGKLKVEKVISFNDFSVEKIIELGAVASTFSKHPISKAIIKYAKEKNIKITEPDKFQEISGKGATAVFKSKKIVYGKIDFLKELKIKIGKREEKEILAEETGGYNTTLVSYAGKLVGFFVCADEIKPKTKEVIKELFLLGVKKIVMLTGDNEKIARRVATEAGISEFHSNLMPENKIEYLKKYLNKKQRTVMVGDGVNDAAALTLADIGIAMGAIGYDAAIESADIVLMRDEFYQVPKIIELGNFVLKISYQNFWIWGIVNAIGLSLVLTGVLAPAGAAAYNFITDFIPLVNSMRVLKLYIKK